jgi:hypothetical protein
MQNPFTLQIELKMNLIESFILENFKRLISYFYKVLCVYY